MPIFTGTSGAAKILGMTKYSDDQWNIKWDTIFHSQLPYVRVIEHDFTQYTNVQDKLYEQEYNTQYWDQNAYGSSRWWCGQRFDFSAQLINSLQNTNRGFMVFIRWNDGYWEPYMSTGFEHDILYTWDNSNNFSLQQNIDVANYYKNTYGLTRYSTGIFIPRKRVNGANRVDPSQYVTNVRVLELIGLDVYSDASVGVYWQNPAQNSQIYIDNTQFVVGGVNIMQEKYLQLMTNASSLSVGSKAHNVQADLIYPASISYSNQTMDAIQQNRQLGMTTQFCRNSPPIIYSEQNTSQPSWNVMSPLTSNLSVLSRVPNWSQLTPDQQVQIGGVWIPRLGDPSNYDTYINQAQSYRRDDFSSRGASTEQYNQSHLMQVGVLNGNKFGSGVYLDTTRPQIGRGGRQLFSPETQGVQRVGPTRKFIIPRECLMTGGLGQVTVYQFHHKHMLTSIQLTQEEAASSSFLLTVQGSFNPPGLVGNFPKSQLTTQPATSGAGLRKTKRSNQDAQVGYQIQGFQVSDSFFDQFVVDLVTYTGGYRQSEYSRQVHQICLHNGDKFIISDTETGANPDQYYNSTQQAGIIQYIERSNDTLYLCSETYVSNNYSSNYSDIGPDGIFCGGLSIGLTQIL